MAFKRKPGDFFADGTESCGRRMARKHSLSMRRRQRSSASENYSHAPSSSPARSGGNGPHHVPGRYVGLGVGLFDSFYGPKERPAGLALGAKDKRQQAAGKARPARRSNCRVCAWRCYRSCNTPHSLFQLTRRLSDRFGPRPNKRLQLATRCLRILSVLSTNPNQRKYF
jgi:hypothetical protein